jgi:threonine aldolase
MTSDFRSDTVTRPTAAMRSAMAEAEVGDDVLDGDPTVGRLERAAAEYLGKPGALFVPSGTMANQVAVGTWTARGEQVVLGVDSHIVRWEGGGAAHTFGAQLLTLPTAGGAFDLDAARAALMPASPHCARTALVCVEQTHGDSGGSVLSLDFLDGVAELARERGLRVHMDGARIANASVASGIPAADFAARADSVSMCFSKGLGAPVGSVIAGSREFLARATHVRKRLGGWMRQSGVIAAAALIALKEGVAQLAQDHKLARDLARAVRSIPGLSCPEEIATNIVMVDVDPSLGSAAALAASLREHGVLVLPMGAGRLRFVTHRDVGPRDVEKLALALQAVAVAPAS